MFPHHLNTQVKRDRQRAECKRECLAWKLTNSITAKALFKWKCTSFECQSIYHESAIWEHYFYVSNWRRDRHITWSSEPLEGLAACSAKGVPLFLSYFKTQSISPTQGIKPTTSRSAVKRSTDWANPTCLNC